MAPQPMHRSAWPESLFVQWGQRFALGMFISLHGGLGHMPICMWRTALDRDMQAGISRAGNRRARYTAVELAWL